MADDDLRWRLGARLPGHDYRVFRTAFVDGEHPRGGAPKRFSVIECVDWVNVIALTEDDRVVLVRQFRPGTNQVCVEIPGGMIDPGETPAAAAARELVEETGFTSAAWRALGRVAANPAIQNNHVHTFLAADAVPTEPPRPEAAEVLAVETVALDDVRGMLRDGRIDHALVVAAFGHLALAQGDLHRPR